MPETLHSTRARPGDPWWEGQVVAALLAFDVQRLTYLARLAEADQRGGADRAAAALAVLGHQVAAL